MDLIPIGEAAARLRMSASALRYYDERGLVRPQERQGGRRMYGSDELRRLAFIKIFHQLGVSLDTAAAVLDAPSPQWREIVREQIAQLDEVIAQAQGAQTVPDARAALSDRSSRARMPHDDGRAGPPGRRHDRRSTRRRALRRPAPDLAPERCPFPRPRHRRPHRRDERAPDQHVPRPRAQHVQQ